jgi:hypothetical protein
VPSAARSALHQLAGVRVDRSNARHEARDLPSADRHALIEARNAQGDTRDALSVVRCLLAELADALVDDGNA